MRRIALFAVICLFALAAAVIAPPVNYYGNVTVDYAFLTQDWNVTVWANCYGAGIGPVASTTVQGVFHFYDLDIPMDEPTPPFPAGIDEGCDPTTPINITIGGNLTYKPLAGSWTVQDTMGYPDGSRPLFAIGPFVLVSPTNASTITDNTTTFAWTHGILNNFSFELVIDTDSGFAAPRTHNISVGSNLTYTLNSSQALGIDGRYYWRIDSYLHGIANGSSSVFYFDLDTTTEAIISVTPANNSWLTSAGQTLSVTTGEAGYCKYDYGPGVAYGTKAFTMTGTGTAHIDGITLLNQGNNSYYIQCNDTLGNVMPLAEEYPLNLRYDNRAPDTSGGSVLIDGGANFTNITTISVNWTGIVDPLCPVNCSDISSYYYNTINNFGSAVASAAPPETIVGVNQGTVNVYVWAEDAAGNLGGPISDGITVDSIPPLFSNWQFSPTPFNSSAIGSVTISVDVTDSPAGINSHLPMLRYKRGSYDAGFTSYTNMSFLGGSTYTYDIPEPAIGSWNNITDQNLQYEVWARDTLNNQNSSGIVSVNATRENYRPTWTQPAAQFATEDVELSFLLEAWDQDTEQLTFTSNDTDLTITALNRSSSTVTWTPTNDDVGTRFVIFTVTDGYVFVNTTPVAIYINNTNDLPVFPTINPQSGYEHEEFYLNVSATDVDVGDNLTYTDDSPDFVIGPTTGIINFTPLVGARGQQNVTVTVFDGTAYVNVIFTLTVYYCGDNVCNLAEDCNICSSDCGICGEEEVDRLAIVLKYRNCLNEELVINVYQLYNRATCDTMGRIVEGYEICGNLSNTGVSVYIENPGNWDNPDDEWNLTGEYSTDEWGQTSFIPLKIGKYKFFAKKGGYPDTTEYAEVDECFREEEINETQQPEDLEPLILPEPEEPLPPEEEEPTILTEEDGSFMLFVIYYILVPIIILSLFSAGTYYYHIEKDNNKYLLLTRIWLKKHSKLLKLYLQYYYHQIKGKLGGGKK